MFLFNNTILNMQDPVAHLKKYWKRVGAGNPSLMRPEDGAEFVQMILKDYTSEGQPVERTTMEDLAALTMVVIGANTIEIRSNGQVNFENTDRKTLSAMARQKLQR